MPDIDQIAEQVGIIHARAASAALFSTIVAMGATQFSNITILDEEMEAALADMVRKALENAALWARIAASADQAADMLLGIDGIED